MHGLVALDAAGRVLRPAILWNDQRTRRRVRRDRAAIGLERLISLTGNRALPGFTAPKLLWLRRHEPDVHARIARIMLPKDYVRLRLCGEFATDVSDASGTLLLDVARPALERGGARGARDRPGDPAAAAREPAAQRRDRGRRAGRGRRRRPGRGRARRRASTGPARCRSRSAPRASSSRRCRPSPPIRRRACTRSATPCPAAGT